MDATTLGSLLVGVGAVVGGVVAYVGKRSENALLRFVAVTDQVQEERDRLQTQLTSAQTEIIGLQQQRQADLLEITRLQVKIIQLGGELP